VELSRFFEIVRGRLLLIALLALGSAAAAFLVSESLPREYGSEARVLVGSLTESSIDQLLANQQLASTYAELAKSTPLLARVAEKLSLSDDPTALADRIDVRAPTGQAIVRIVARGPSPVAAQQLADGVAAGILMLATPTGAVASLASIVQPAVYPDGPSSPRILLNTLIAALAGLGLGLGLALLFPSRGAEGRLPAPQLADTSVREGRGVVTGGTTGRGRAAPATNGVRRRSLGSAYLRLLLLGAFGGHRYYLGDVDGGRRYLATLLFGAGLALEGLLVVRAWPEQASIVGLVLGIAGLLLLAGVLVFVLRDAVRLPALVRGANAAADQATP
jgi:capsular polysaccharide biosynthesis protein